jgi:nitroreductase
MLAATDLGVNSIPAYELVKYPYILRDNLPIPEDEDIVMGIALGYESDEPSTPLNPQDWIWMKSLKSTNLSDVI